MEEILARLKKFTAAVTEIDKEIDALLAHETLTEEQQAQYAALKADREKTIAAIARDKDKLAREEQRLALEAENEAIARRANPAPGANRILTPDPQTVNNPGPTPGLEQFHHVAAGLTRRPNRIIPAGVRRIGQLQHFRGTDPNTGLTADERAYRFGMWGLALLSMQMPGRYRFKEAVDWLDKEMAAASSRDASGEQYLIPEEFGQDLIILREQYGVVRKLFKIVPMTSDTRTDPRRQSGLIAYFPAENAAGTESKKTWDNVRLTARDLMVLSRVSNQVKADMVINWGDDLAGEIAYAFANKEDDCGLNGDGTSTYGGIVGARTALSLAGAGSPAGLVSGSGGTWSALALVDFESVVGKLPQYADSTDASWVCHRAFYYTVMLRLELAAGGNAQQEVANGDRRPRPLFLGYPVTFSQIMPGATASTTIHALLGNFPQGASFGDRQQNSIAFSEHATVGGENVFERNQIAIRGTERLDIVVHDVGDATNPGPIVGLKTT